LISIEKVEDTQLTLLVIHSFKGKVNKLCKIIPKTLLLLRYIIL